MAIRNTGIYTQSDYRNSGGVVNKLSKEYRDVSLSFEPNPLNGDITVLRNERAINNAIKNIILFLPGEVPFDREVGSHAQRHIFDMIGEVAEGVLSQEIERAILFCEPRVTFTPWFAEVQAARPEADIYYANQPVRTTNNRKGYTNDDNPLGVTVNPMPDQNGVEVQIVYRIVGEERIYEIQEILTPTR